MRYEVIRNIIQTESDVEYLDDVLADRWEPFAVTTNQHGEYVYHLRRLREFE